MRVMVWLVLIAGYADGRRRAQQEDKRAQLYLPKRTFLKERVERHGLHHLRLYNRSSADPGYLSDGHCRISTCVKVKFGSEYRGPLTNWSQEDFMLWEYYGCPLDAWSPKPKHVDNKQ